ncbi:hypothetical protein WDV06_08270 [Streptomyces racemochromogenes]|uniref:HTH lysR-type domain-containing protein n=1 Tax=Streptomyces racemochromogenes TaxID=67353 RepID=A0ABW7PAR5_9ACTN
MSKALGVAERTIADAHGFLRQNGLFEAGCQTFTLTPAGRRLAELRALDSAHARLYLRELWASAWFTTAAVGLLRPCPHDATALAEHLIRGVSRRIERGLHLVHWLEYALVVRKGEDGRMTLVRETLTPPPSLSFMVTSEAVAGLPRERFLKVMDAYRTITRALSPSPQPAETSPRDQQHA